MISFAHATVANGAHQVAYYTAGQGPALVFIPSLARSAEDFEEIANIVAGAGHRMIAIEARGIGGSNGPIEGMTLHDLASDVAAVVKAECTEPVVVIGHAFGNWVARTFAADHGDLVRGVVLAAAARKGTIEPATRGSISASFDLSLSDEERLSHMRKVFFAPSSDPTVWLGGWHPELAPHQRKAGESTPYSEWWAAGGTLPILDLQAANDATTPPERSRELAEEFGDRIRIVKIDNAGHALFPEQPEAAVDEIVRFAQSL